MIEITLDTSCLELDYPELNELTKFIGKIKLFVEIPSEVEKECLKNEEKKNKSLHFIKLYTTQHIPVYKKGESPPWSEKDYVATLKKVAEIHTPSLGNFSNWKNLTDEKFNSVRVDCKLCTEHILFKRDYFVTLDKKGFINGGRKEKFEEIGARIRSLDKDFIDEIKDLIGE